MYIYSFFLGNVVLGQNCIGSQDALMDIQNKKIKWFYLYDFPDLIKGHCEFEAWKYYGIKVEAYSPNEQEVIDSLLCYNEEIERYLSIIYSENWRIKIDSLKSDCINNLLCGINLDSVSTDYGIPKFLFTQNSSQIDERFICMYDKIFEEIFTANFLDKFTFWLIADISPEESTELKEQRFKSVEGYLKKKINDSYSLKCGNDWSGSSILGVDISPDYYYYFRCVNVHIVPRQKK